MCAMSEFGGVGGTPRPLDETFPASSDVSENELTFPSLVGGPIEERVVATSTALWPKLMATQSLAAPDVPELSTLTILAGALLGLLALSWLRGRFKNPSAIRPA